MPGSSIITDPIEYINSLKSQINAFKAHLEDKRNWNALEKSIVANKDVYKYLRFCSSFVNATLSPGATLSLNSNNQISRFDSVSQFTEQYSKQPLSAFTSYLFKLMAYLDDRENLAQSTPLPVKDKITVQEFVKIIGELDERLTAQQATKDESCVIYKVTSSEIRENLWDKDKRTTILKENLSSLIPFNAAYVISDDKLFYINKKEGIYKPVDNVIFKSKEVEAALQAMNITISPDGSSEPLSQDALTQIYAITAHHHLDRLENVKENFSEFKRAVLPYLQARKILAYAESETSSPFITSDKDTFASSLEQVSNNLTQLQGNANALEKIKTALEHEQAEKLLLEQRKQEEAQRKKLQQEEDQRVEASKKDVPLTKLLIDNLFYQGNKGILQVQFDVNANGLNIYSNSSDHLSMLVEAVNKIFTDDTEKHVSTSADNTSLFISSDKIEKLCNHLNLTCDDTNITSQMIREELESVYAVSTYKDKPYDKHEVDFEGKIPKPLPKELPQENVAIDEQKTKNIDAIQKLITTRKLDLSIQENRDYWTKQVSTIFGKGGAIVEVTDSVSKEPVKCKVPHGIAYMQAYLQTWNQLEDKTKISDELTVALAKNLAESVSLADKRYTFFKPTRCGMRKADTVDTYKEIETTHLTLNKK